MTTFEIGARFSISEPALIEIFGASDRAAVIVAAALFDEKLKDLLRGALKASPTDEELKRLKGIIKLPSSDQDKLFDKNRPLNPFSARIDLAERMGLIDPLFAVLLHYVRDLRNKFAHELTVSGNSVADRSKNLITAYFSLFMPIEKTLDLSHLELRISGTYDSAHSPLKNYLDQQNVSDGLLLRLALISMFGELRKHTVKKDEPVLQIVLTTDAETHFTFTIDHIG